MVVALEKYNQRRLLENDDSTLRLEDFYDNIRVYAVNYVSSNDISKQHFTLLKLHQIIDGFEHVITMHLALPEVDNGK